MVPDLISAQLRAVLDARISRGRSSRTMQRLVDGTTVEDFLRRVLERRTIHLPPTAARARWFEQLFGREVFVKGLPRYRLEHIHLLWRTKYRDLSALGKPSTRVGANAPAILSALAKPQTGMLLKSIQNYHPKIARLVADLEPVFGAKLNVNAYVSMSRGTIFAEHWDTHDVMMLQTAGAKRWHLRENRLALPLQRHRALPDKKLQKRTVERVMFETGAVLYMPRGLWHRGIGHDSIHLSFGFPEHTVSTRVESALQHAVASCFDREEFRLTLDAVADSGKLPDRLVRHYVRGVLAQLRRELPGRMRNG